MLCGVLVWRGGDEGALWAGMIGFVLDLTRPARGGHCRCTLAEQAGLSRLLAEHVRFVDEWVKSGAANSTPKLTSIIAGMAAGADSIDDLDVVRAGGMNKLFGGVYAAATLGVFLREFTHGHARQLSTVLRKHLVALAGKTTVLAGIGQRAFIDIDSVLRVFVVEQGATHFRGRRGRAHRW